MCGICGFISFSTAPGGSVLRNMNATLRRRGPDGEGYFEQPPVGLAMRRLAIVDVMGGQQPIHNEDGTVTVVFNGEIYNYRELRSRLKAAGHHLATHSDTETLVHLYEEHVLDFVNHLRGMFTIALWDSKSRRLILARDRLGIKPLYWFSNGDALFFGSELKALLACGMIQHQVDWDAVDQYLAYGFIPAPRSIYRGVHKLEPATLMVVEADGRMARRRYWNLPVTEGRPRSEDEWLEEVEAALAGAVRSHLVADVPVGAFLSGGIDSGLVVAMMADAAVKPQAFTVGFSEGALIDERPYARMLAARYPIEHHEIEVSPRVETILPDIVRAFDEPFSDDSVIPSYYVSQAAAAHVKVVQSGLGGDELFGGYKRHLGIKLGGAYQLLPPWLRQRIIAPALAHIPDGILAGDVVDHVKRFAGADGASAATRYQSYMASLSTDERRLLYRPEHLRHLDLDATLAVMTQPFLATGSADAVQNALHTDLSVYLPDDVLALTDRLSMWHSLEVRVPFLDHPLVELAASMPSRLKVGVRRQKLLLRRIAYRWLPQPMIEHRKQGFEAPMARWLRGPLRPMLEDLLLGSTPRLGGRFDRDLIDKLVTEHLQGTRKHSKVLFSLLMLEMWERANRPR